MKESLTALILPLLLTSLILTASSAATGDADEISSTYYECLNTTYFTPNTTFQSNLKTLLDTLSSNTETPSGFFNFTAGKPPDTAYGLYLCRGDIKESECKSCVSKASQELPQRCPGYRKSVIWYDHCMLKYSGENIFSVMETVPSEPLSTNLDVMAAFCRAQKCLLNLVRVRMQKLGILVGLEKLIHGWFVRRMCLMCSIQKWSRQIATMLPWLVIPFIGLWALSQLLPPAYRFEITSPRIACVVVLMFTLFWYEVFMPRLSAWQLRRDAQLRERKRFEAIELQKLRKFATKRCRNCLTPYRDQNPGGGRFMCSYCGHISKRPVLDLPVPPGMGMAGNGVFKDLVGRGGKLLNGHGWLDNGWTCGQDWLENGSWGGGGGGGSYSGNASYWQRNASNRLYGGEEDSLSEKAYSRVVIFAWKLLTSFFLIIKWLCRKVFRIGFSGDDSLSDANSRGMSSKRGENGGNCNESRGAKARRKAEEKKQARLEKELLEEEERRQREEVARLVEERLKLRDEIEAEKNRGKMSLPAKERYSRKEVEKRHQERRKDRDRCSSKSNSDAEEIEKRVGKESERRRDSDKKSETDRQEYKRPGSVGNIRSHVNETGHGVKSTANSSSRVNTGSRYFDRMKGSLLSSSKAFSGTSFFGKAVTNSTTNVKGIKSSNCADHVYNSAYRRELNQTDHQAGRLSLNADDKNVTRPVFVETQSRPAPKKSWHQLFTRASPVTSSNAKVISRPTPKSPAKVQSPPLSGQPFGTQSYDNPISFGLPSPFPLPTYPNVSTGCSLGFSSPIEPIFPLVGEGLHDRIPEEQELFEDPSYVPDPVSLLGPVSESLDNFQLDLGTGLTPGTRMEKPSANKSLSSAFEVNKQSPIESPLSRLRFADDNQSSPSRLPISPKVHDIRTSVDMNEKGTWQMWSSSTLGQGGLGLVEGLPSWILSSDGSRSNKVDVAYQPAQKVMGSQEDQLFIGNCSPQTGNFCNGQNGGNMSPIFSPNGHDTWVEKAFFPSVSASENHFLLKPQQYSLQNEIVNGSPNLLPVSQPYELSSANCWSKKELARLGSEEGVGKPSVARPVGGLFPTSDVQSLW